MKSHPSLLRRGSSALVLSALAVTVVGTVSGGCSKIELPEAPALDGGGDGTGNGMTGPLPDMVSIRGFIKNSQGAPVADAEITVGNQMSAASDNNGLFDVEAEPNPEDVVLKISAPDHAPQVVKVPIKTNVLNYGVPIVMQRIQNIAIGPDDLHADVFIGGGNATITFDEPMGESATLRFVSPPAQDGPGELRFVGGDESEALQTAGIVWLEVVDGDENLVGMPGGIIEVDVEDLPDIDDAGDWQGFKLDDDQGLWDDPDDAAAGVPPKLTFVLPPSGYWSVNRKYPTACVRGVVAPADGGNSCSGGMVKASGPLGLSSMDSIGADGSFCIEGAVATATTVSIGSYQFNAPLPNEKGHCGQIEKCNDLGEIEIPAGSCELSDEPPSFAIGDACTTTAQCGTGGECFNGYCVGTGAMRVSLAFSLASDLDLHLLTPGGEEIAWNTPTAGGGELDLDQCANAQCMAVPHAENIVFADSPPAGTYEVWVVNYEGAGGEFTIEISGEVEQVFTGTVGAGNGSTTMSASEHFTFTVGAAGDAGAADGG